VLVSSIDAHEPIVAIAVAGASVLRRWKQSCRSIGGRCGVVANRTPRIESASVALNALTGYGRQS
jgi:hypothetical protein